MAQEFIQKFGKMSNTMTKKQQPLATVADVATQVTIRTGIVLSLAQFYLGQLPILTMDKPIVRQRDISNQSFYGLESEASIDLTPELSGLKAF